jgi:hypothetical protein
MTLSLVTLSRFLYRAIDSLCSLARALRKDDSVSLEREERRALWRTTLQEQFPVPRTRVYYYYCTFFKVLVLATFTYVARLLYSTTKIPLL